MAPSQSGDAAKPSAGSPRGRAWWPRVKRVATWVFFGLVAWLIFEQARNIDWSEVLASMAAIPLPVMLAAAALAACSFALYSTFDLLGRHVTGHRLPTTSVMSVTFISYAFNLNLGSLVGGVAFRYRLYSRLGLDNNTITRVLGFSMLTNWFGYLVVAGAAFCFWPMGLPPQWKIDSGGLRVLGAVLLCVAGAYLVLCAVSRERTWEIRGHAFQAPTLRMALLQLAMSCANWALIGTVIWVLLEQRVAYPHVLAVLLVAAVAGVITHVPAGLGVLEAVFVALLSHEIATGRLLGALLAYRAVYYLLPLGIATLAFLGAEWRMRRSRSASSPHPG